MKLEKESSFKKTDKIPDYCLCSITREVMMEPVVASDGFTYEREAIEKWFAQKTSTVLSPMTGLPISRHLTPNHALQTLIKEYIETANP